MDGYQIRKGLKYKYLKKLIVIFICTYDPYGYSVCVISENKWTLKLGCFLDSRRNIIVEGDRKGKLMKIQCQYD